MKKSNLIDIAPAFLTTILFCVAIFGIALPTLKKTLIEEKKKTITVLTETAYSILVQYDEQVSLGQLSLDKAQNMAKEQIKKLRYGPDGKDYFWINDTYPRMVMHPYLPEMDKQDLSNYADKEGIFLFKEIVRFVSENNVGFIPYFWQHNDNPDRISPKLSYIKLFAPWGWVIGTGVYTDYVQMEMRMISKKLIYLSTTILAIISIILAAMVQRNLRNIKEREIADHKLAEHQKSLEKTINERTLELQNLNQQLKKERKKLCSILDAIPAFIYLQAPDYTIRFANLFYREHFGETEGKYCYESLRNRNEPCDPCPTFKVFETKKSQVWEWNDAPDGHTYEISDHPYNDTDGTELVFKLGIDITERKKIGLEKETLIKELRTALDEINTLRGIIPICMHCKKIRGDDGAWNQIEKYLTEHTDAKLSHGLCEGCAKKHYPDFIKAQN